MIATLEAGAHVIEITASGSRAPGARAGQPLRFGDRVAAVEFVRRFKRDWLAMRALRAMVAGGHGVAAAPHRRELCDDDVVDLVAGCLLARQLVAVAHARASGDATRVEPRHESAGGPPATTSPEPARDEVVNVWILSLNDSDGNPVPNARYVALWPGGERREGRLGRDGTAELSGVPPEEPLVYYTEHFVEAPPGHALAASGRERGCGRCA